MPEALSPQHLLEIFGVVGVMVILFAETGLLVGVILPGDSLLFVAGYAAVEDNALPGDWSLPLGWLLVAAAVGAIVGAQVGHEIGRRAGPRLFRRPDARLFKQEYVDRCGQALDRFGPRRAIVLARFIPIVRTFLNPLCGAVGMPARTFAVWNVIGGLVWTVGLILAGHALGNVELVRDNIELIAIVVVALSLIPIAYEALRRRRGHPAR